MATEREEFINRWEKELATTKKVLAAYPKDKLDLKPHPRSRSARELAWTLVVEEPILINGALTGVFDFMNAPKPPATMGEILAAYDSNHSELVAKIKKLSDDDFNKKVKFMAGPGKIIDVRAADVCWILLNDTIHHRGQFSVYLRMADGKVPSIYGPSGDEPWM
jgi:uncharacterized damage-inducible protein DinB